jgi:hypothetical protein
VAPSRNYEARATTNSNGVATLSITLEPTDQNQELWTSLTVENTNLSQFQQAVPVIDFGC